MSIKFMLKVMEMDLESTVSRMVLLKLADNSNDDGFCFPSQAYLAQHCGLSRETVNRHIKKLESIGLVEIIKGFKGIDRNRSVYRLHFESKSDGESHLPVTENHTICDLKSHLPVTENHTHNNVLTSHINQSEEPVPPLPPPAGEVPKNNFEHTAWIKDLWNDLTAGVFQSCRVWSSKHHEYALKIMDDHPDRQDWQDAILILTRSPHCTGNNDRGWKATLAFLLNMTQKNAFEKILAGTYGGELPSPEDEAAEEAEDYRNFYEYFLQRFSTPELRREVLRDYEEHWTEKGGRQLAPFALEALRDLGEIDEATHERIVRQNEEVGRRWAEQKEAREANRGDRA